MYVELENIVREKLLDPDSKEAANIADQEMKLEWKVVGDEARQLNDVHPRIAADVRRAAELEYIGILKHMMAILQEIKERLSPSQPESGT